MTWAIVIWLLMIATTFFAGIYGIVIMRGYTSLMKVRYLLAAKALDGLLLGMGTASWVQVLIKHRVVVHPANIPYFIWIWFAVRGLVALTTWLFVLDAAGRIGRSRGNSVDD